MDKVLIKDKKGRKRFLFEDDEITEYPVEEEDDGQEDRGDTGDTGTSGSTSEAKTV